MSRFEGINGKWGQCSAKGRGKGVRQKMKARGRPRSILTPDLTKASGLYPKENGVKQENMITAAFC